MKVYNLIKLGALAQKKFDMHDNFNVFEINDIRGATILDSSRIVLLRYMDGGPQNMTVITPEMCPTSDKYAEECVELILVGEYKINDYAWIGYSSKANTLCVCFE